MEVYGLVGKQMEKLLEVKHAKSKADEIECVLLVRLSQLFTLNHSYEFVPICKNRWKHNVNHTHSTHSSTSKYVTKSKGQRSGST